MRRCVGLRGIKLDIAKRLRTSGAILRGSLGSCDALRNNVSAQYLTIIIAAQLRQWQLVCRGNHYELSLRLRSCVTQRKAPGKILETKPLRGSFHSGSENLASWNKYTSISKRNIKFWLFILLRCVNLLVVLKRSENLFYYILFYMSKLLT